LSGVREAARKRRQERFTVLLHYVSVDLLRDSYDALKRQAAPGVDGLTWQEYETGLENRLADLHNRVHTVERIGHNPHEESASPMICRLLSMVSSRISPSKTAAGFPAQNALWVN